ncbi:MAG TPA: alpha/beta hydrolase-fold protein, partial [Ignavibacteriaceae bacterium]
MKLIDGKWQIELSIEKAFNLEFKFTRGTWETEALNDSGSVPPNHILKVLKDTTLTFKINLWLDQVNQNNKKKISGQITGTVMYHKNFKGRNIKPRDIVVWLPPDYNESDSICYPVLYMQDGQNAFDPITSAFGTDWQIDEAADSLIRKNYITPIIIIGIYNSVERRSEYANNDTGYAYIKFMIEELKPFIDSRYKTLPDAIHTAVIGSSLGGLISFIIAWENPEIFSMAACLSPAIKIDRYDYVSVIKNYSGEKNPDKIYIDNGGIGGEEELQPGIDETLSLLYKYGYEDGKNLFWIKDPSSGHNETAWANRVWRPLIYFFGTGLGKKILNVN